MGILEVLRDKLHSTDCSCVIGKADTITTFHQRGVKDLYELLRQKRELLDGASIADKVVGKGAASLMIAGGIKELYAEVISEAAMELFDQHGIMVQYNTRVPHIINRTRDDICPVEKRCAKCKTIEECIVEIDKFVNNN